MPRWARITSYTLGVFVLLLIITAIFLSNSDLGFLKGPTERIVSSLTGRTLTIDGEFKLELTRHASLTVTDVRFSNPQWGAAEDMLTTERFSVRIDLLTLFEGAFLIEEISARGVRINLEADNQEQVNWVFENFAGDFDGAEIKSAGTTGPLPFLINKVDINELSVSLIHPALEEKLVLDARYLGGTRFESGAYRLETEATVSGRSFTANIEIGSLESLVTGKDFRYQASIQGSVLQVSSTGIVDNIFAPVAPQLDFTMEGPELAEVLKIMKLRPVSSGPIDLSGSVMTDDEGITAKLNGQVGEFRVDATGFASSLNDLATGEIVATTSGPDLSVLGVLIGMKGLPEQPYEITANMRKQGSKVTIEELILIAEDVRISGSAAIDNFPDLRNANAKAYISGSDLSRLRKIFGAPGLLAEPFSASIELQNRPDTVGQLRGSLKVAGMELIAEGYLGEFPDYKGTHARVSAQGDRFSDFGDVLGQHNWPADPYSLTGELEISDGGIDLNGFVFSLGGHRLTVDGVIGSRPLEQGTRFDLVFNGPDLTAFAWVGGQTNLPEEDFEIAGTVAIQDGSLLFNDVIARLAGAEVKANGRIVDIRTPNDISASITATGAELDRLIPDTENLSFASEPFDVTADVHFTSARIEATNIDIRIGEGYIKGSAWFSLIPEEPGGKVLLSGSGKKLSNLLPELPNYTPPDSSFDLNIDADWEGDAWRIDELALSVGDASISLNGELDMPPDLRATDITLLAQGSSLSVFGALNQRPLPDIPFDLTSTFSGTLNTFRMEELKSRFGESDISASLLLTVENPPFAELVLVSQVLDLRPFFAQPESENTAPETDTDGLQRLIPDHVIPVDILRSVNGSADLSISELHMPTSGHSGLGLIAKLQDSVLSIDKFNMSTLRGTVSAQASMALVTDGGADIDLELHGTGIHFSLLAETPEERSMLPANDLTIQLNGTGKTTREVAASLNGSIRIVGREGKVKNSGLNLLFGDFLQELLNTVNPLSRSEPYTTIACSAYLFKVENGLIIMDPGIVIQTNKLNILSKGIIDLSTEKLDVNFKTQARKGIGISAGNILNNYIKVGGTLVSPKIVLDPTGTLVSSGAAVASYGLTIIVPSLWNRWFGPKDPCKAVIAEADKDQ